MPVGIPEVHSHNQDQQTMASSVNLLHLSHFPITTIKRNQIHVKFNVTDLLYIRNTSYPLYTLVKINHSEVSQDLFFSKMIFNEIYNILN